MGAPGFLLEGTPTSFSGEFFEPGDQAALNCLSHAGSSQESGLCSQSDTSQPSRKNMGFVGLRVRELGPKILQGLLEVLPLRGKSMGDGGGSGLFPLPTSRNQYCKTFPDLEEEDVCWMVALAVSLNSLWGHEVFSNREIFGACKENVVVLLREVTRLKDLLETTVSFDWDAFFATRGIDYKGDEVKTACNFCWGNIQPALPKEIGLVPLAEVCSQGARFYVDNFDRYIKKEEEWVLKRPPRVMVSDADWPDVCRGLVKSGICVYMPVGELFHTGDRPLLNGLFGVSKDEFCGGYEVYRLIMNLVPLNAIAQPLQGDVATLPMWSLMSPFFLQPEENLLISSEDVRCFFYTMAVPPAWYKYLGFNKRVPEGCLPPELQGQEVYRCSRVLPMGFTNSVSLAQHVHRNLTLWSNQHAPAGAPEVNKPEDEIRKDRPMTVGEPSWRVYLDNYDLLERVSATGMVDLQGTHAPAILCLRQEYERWDIPRNLKKAISRSPEAEVQGAQVDGVTGIAYPRECKLLKYMAAGLTLLQQDRVTQKQMQVVCGGLVYISMFRRQLLGGLNAVWRLIEDFNRKPGHARWLPTVCKLEIARFLALIPLARMDFRLGFDGQVTCSDASTSGGGICVSTQVSRAGALAASGRLRGQLPELRQDHRVLTIGLFDGIGALRVAVDLLGLELIGHISVEKDKRAQRVVESHFPETLVVSDVATVTQPMVQEWALKFSQASVVLLGAGPPCQGVSGLNATRKGALRDERSSLFTHVKRIQGLVAREFPWAQVHTLMESVASMDSQDREHMTASFGAAPLRCDAGTMSWCSRPRLYWLTWELRAQTGATQTPGEQGAPDVLELVAEQDLEEVCKDGWIKVDPMRPFPTFTTSRPRETAGHKPAGLAQCRDEEVRRWQEDKFRYPPYQYCTRNCLISQKNEIRLPSIEEKEVMLGFPVGYTAMCSPKSMRKTLEHLDARHTLVGNTWSVPVVAWLLGQLFSGLGFCPAYSPQEIVDLLKPGGQAYLQARLWRPSLRAPRGGSSASPELLVQQLSNLISVKGEDILLTTPSSQLSKFHRLRASIPAKLWRWRIVAGWQWKGSKEHINALELRAILTSLKWRLIHNRLRHSRFLHLTDSLVCLHILSRGRSSSRKLRATMSRINALLLATSTQPLWGYIHTDQNPADRPSRWGTKVRTKFRNAKKGS